MKHKSYWVAKELEGLTTSVLEEEICANGTNTHIYTRVCVKYL